MAPAVAAGLLVQQPEDSPADYTFPHEQVREFAADTLAPARRREIHGAIVQLLLTGEPAPETLPLLAHHARAAGDAQVCVRFSIEAAAAALAAHAPDEVLRVVEIALPQAATPQERLGLLTARDDALAMLRRPGDRLEGLSELAALAEALGDPAVDLDVTLRRSAALRLSQQEDRAAELAARVRTLAAERGDRPSELAACVALGQALLHAGLGEGFTPVGRRGGPRRGGGGLPACGGARRGAGGHPDPRRLHPRARRDRSRPRPRLVRRAGDGGWTHPGDGTGGRRRGDRGPRRGASDRSVGEVVAASACIEPWASIEELGDRQGTMATIIAMAYLSWAPDIHIGADSARHIEEIRRLASQLASFTSESQRAFAEVQMLYGVHVFARAKVIPDLALSRGAEAYERARAIGDRQLEFLAAGGTAMSNLELGDLDEATSWLDRAAAVAAESPTPARGRQQELWRGLSDAARGDADGMRAHLERAVQMAADQGLPGGALRGAGDARARSGLPRRRAR